MSVGAIALVHSEPVAINEISSHTVHHEEAMGDFWFVKVVSGRNVIREGVEPLKFTQTRGTLLVGWEPPQSAQVTGPRHGAARVRPS